MGQSTFSAVIRMLWRELRFKPMTSTVVVLAVAVAVAAAISTTSLILGFDKQTQNQAEALQQRSHQRMEALENEARVFSKTLGFNLFVYPRDLNLQAFFQEDKSDRYFPFEDAQKLADSEFPFMNHMLPILRHKYHWKAYGDEVIIGGIHGQIYIKRKWQKPIQQAIAAGTVHLGAGLVQKMGLVKGDKVNLGGKEFIIQHCRAEVGSKDDFAVLMNLADAQQLLQLPNQISGVLALSCNCAAGDLKPIRDALGKILPEAEVVEFAIRSKARAQARKAIQKATAAEVKDVAQARDTQRKMLAQFSSFITAFLAFCALALLIFFHLNNVKERRFEIATLRAFGFTTGYLSLLFVLKGIAVGLTGYMIGSLGSHLLLDQVVSGSFADFSESGSVRLEEALELLLGVCGASAVASWVPLLVVGSRPPGEVFNQG